MKSASDILEAVASLPKRPEAVQALWDGDTTGWMVYIDAVFSNGGSYQTTNIAVLRGDGGDMRLFHGSVPPWPEAQVASAAGLLIERQLKIPFFFPSPDEPEEECPNWWERQSGKQCKSCNKILLQEATTPWFGSCYQCHLKNERSAPRKA